MQSMDKWNKADWIKKIQNEIENHRQLIAALILVRDVAKTFDGKVINARFFNKIKEQSKDESNKHGKVFVSWYEYGQNEFKLSVPNMDVTPYERELTIYNPRAKYGEPQTKFINNEGRLDYSIFSQSIHSLIEGQLAYIDDKENGLKKLDECIATFQDLKRKYIDAVNKFPVCLKPTHEMYIEMPIREANTIRTTIVAGESK